MKYAIEFELPDNETVQESVKRDRVHWMLWGYGDWAKAKPVEELKRGKWEMVRDNSSFILALVCSVCGYQNEELNEHRYCPNCGTRMEVTE